MVPLKGFVFIFYLLVLHHTCSQSVFLLQTFSYWLFVFVFPVAADPKLLTIVLFCFQVALVPIACFCSSFLDTVSFSQVQFHRAFPSLNGSLKLYSTDSLGRRNPELWL